MKVIVTCGPSYEPIDEVRRITNFSTGELGVQLSNALARAGFEVFCFKGSGATFPGPGQECHLSLFNTNDDLLELLTQTSANRLDWTILKPPRLTNGPPTGRVRKGTDLRVGMLSKLRRASSVRPFGELSLTESKGTSHVSSDILLSR